MSDEVKLISLITIALLFSTASHATPKMDANSDGEITQEEYVAHFDSEFIKKDKNFDGRLTTKERRDWRKEQTRKAMSESFKKIDPNNDGKLTEDEYAEGLFGEMKDQIPTEQLYLDKTFDEMDEDHNGHVSRLEYKNFVDRNMKSALKLMEDSTREQFKMLDKDKDGLVTNAEYLSQLDVHENLSSATIFDSTENDSPLSKPVSLDGNNDGVITRTEQREYAVFLFERTDRDNDGVITKIEGPLLFLDADVMGGQLGVQLESQILTR